MLRSSLYVTLGVVLSSINEVEYGDYVTWIGLQPNLESMLIIAMITRLVILNERGIIIDISMGLILIVISYKLLNKLKIKHL